MISFRRALYIAGQSGVWAWLSTLAGSTTEPPVFVIRDASVPSYRLVDCSVPSYRLVDASE